METQQILEILARMEAEMKADRKADQARMEVNKEDMICWLK
jgi:hypothetical protein